MGHGDDGVGALDHICYFKDKLTPCPGALQLRKRVRHRPDDEALKSIPKLRYEATNVRYRRFQGLTPRQSPASDL